MTPMNRKQSTRFVVGHCVYVFGQCQRTIILLFSHFFFDTQCKLLAISCSLNPCVKSHSFFCSRFYGPRSSHLGHASERKYSLVLYNVCHLVRGMYVYSAVHQVCSKRQLNLQEEAKVLWMQLWQQQKLVQCLSLVSYRPSIYQTIYSIVQTKD